ncbi:hypothetical protein [Candidatus Poriferisocius sp.]
MSSPEEIQGNLEMAQSLAEFGAGGSANDYLDQAEQQLSALMED